MFLYNRKMCMIAQGKEWEIQILNCYIQLSGGGSIHFFNAGIRTTSSHHIYAYSRLMCIKSKGFLFLGPRFIHE